MTARVTALLVVMLAIPAAARAATVSLYVPPCEEEQSKYGQCYPDEARFVAAAGEQNRLTITRTVDPVTYAPLVTMHDDGAPVTAGAGCKQADDHTVTCTGYNVLGVADLGDGDDSSTGPGSVKGGAGNDTVSGASMIDGGPGNDTLVGTDGSDSISGGPGDDAVDARDGSDVIFDGGLPGERDVISGGAGSDLLSYEDRTTGIAVSLEETATNEDQVSGIENLRGGAGDDKLTGDAGPNTLDGGPGRDALAGLDGNDTLKGGVGGDELNGGAGDDQLDHGVDSARNRFSCGSGSDEVEPASNTVVGSDCERVVLVGVALDGTLRLNLPLRRLSDPVLSWERPDCLDRPCVLSASLTSASTGQLFGKFRRVVRRVRANPPRRVALRLNAAGRRAALRRRSARVLIKINDGGDRQSESFLISLERS